MNPKRITWRLIAPRKSGLPNRRESCRSPLASRRTRRLLLSAPRNTG